MRRATLILPAAFAIATACSRGGSARAPSAPVATAAALVSSTSLSPTLVAGTGGAPGSISGAIVLDGTPPPIAQREITVDRTVCGSDPRVDRSMVVDPASHGVRYAVVTLAPKHPDPRLGPVTRTSGANVAVEQSRCELFPYVTLVAPGEVVDFVNDDPALHDLHRLGPDGTGSHDADPPGTTVPLAFVREGRTRIVCDLHYWTTAWVVATTAPFAGITGADGSFALRNVPPGDYTLTVWHERLGEKTVDVTVRPGENLREEIGLTLPKPAAPGPSAQPSPTPAP